METKILVSLTREQEQLPCGKMDNRSFLAHHIDQLQKMGLPTHLHTVVAQKILENTFDAGLYFSFALRENSDNESNDTDDDNKEDTVHDSRSESVGDNQGDVSIDDQVTAIDPLDSEESAILSNHNTTYSLHAIDRIPLGSDIFLIDHCWTTTFPQSREQLRNIAGLADRLASMFKCSEGDSSPDVDRLWQSVWPHMNCYTVSEDEYTQWYVMDEVGTSIMHHPEPNVRCCPLLVQLQPHQPGNYD